MDGLFSRRVVLITGKGGVGRSTVAAALAVAGGRQGKRILLTELQEPARVTASPLARLFGLETLPRVPKDLCEGVEGLVLRSEKGVQLFLESVLPIKAFARLALRSPALVRLLRAAPSFHEMGIFYHLLSLLRERVSDDEPRYELILIDMPATGHTISLTGLPALLLRIIPSGPIARSMREGQSILNDPAQAGAWVVTLPETLPVTEALELIDALRETKMPVGGVVANRVPEDPFTPEEHVALRSLLEGQAVYGVGELDRLRQADRSVSRLRRALDVPLALVEELPGQGGALVEAVAARLAGASA